MASPVILRLRRTDKQTVPLLLNIKAKGSGNLRNVKIIALDREEEHLYHGNVKDSTAHTLLVSKDETASTWKQIISFVLLHEQPNGPVPEHFQGVQAVASIEGATATITIRKHIEGITQKLGSISLRQNDEEEVNVVEWADSAVAASDDLRSQLQDLQTSISSQRDEIAQLTAQLDELTKLKKESEDHLLIKFAALLNAKKLKIRDQQRLLSGIKLDPAVEQDAMSAREETMRHIETSRSSKRKLNDADDVMEDVEDDVNEVEGEDVEDAEMDEMEVAQASPEQSEAETEEEDDEEGEQDLPVGSPAGTSNGLDTESRRPKIEHASSSVGRDYSSATLAAQPDDDDTEDDEL